MRHAMLPVTSAALAGLLLLAGCTSAVSARAEITRPEAVITLTAGIVKTHSPGRSAAEYIWPARYRAVTVSATAATSGRTAASKAFTSAVVIAELARVLNRAHAMPAGTTPFCPRPGRSYELAFATRPGAQPRLIAQDFGCGVVVTVDGKVQPYLATSLAGLVTHLLGQGSQAPR
jgi:hypothetical protein